MPTVALHTLGCKLNQAETSTIGRQFLDRGFALVEFGEPADVCVINTCSVTGRADRDCRRLIRKALRSREECLVIVTGCYAQLAPEEIASIRGVDLVLGAHEKFSVFDYLGSLSKSRSPRVVVSDIGTLDSFGPAQSTVDGGRTRAFLKVQDGCDYSCTFCTIPLARGRSRSQPVGECADQARQLVESGFREIVLTGVNVGDYGERATGGLLPLLKELVRVDGLERIRISSVEPNLLTDEIIEFVASHSTLCRHFHIPLQSGSDDILHAMRRRYTSLQYRALIERVRSRIPDCGIGVDVIVGFPGESDAHFETTYRFLADLPVSYLHVFTYSERPNTPAAHFGGQVEPEARSRRNDMLRILSQKKKRAFFAAAVGRTMDVLAEGDVEDGVRSGLTDNYVRVVFSADDATENSIVPVEITGVRGEVCVGNVVLDGVEH